MRSKAFTLIELLVVVAIIGILAAVGVVAYNGYTNSAKVSVSKSNHNTVVKKLNLLIQECHLSPNGKVKLKMSIYCLLYTSPSPRDGLLSRMPSSA